MRLGPKSILRGDLRAEAVVINPGAKIRGGSFQIATEREGAQKGLADLPGNSPLDETSNAAPGSEVEAKPKASPRKARSAPEKSAPTKKKILRKKVIRKKVAKKAKTHD